MAWAVRAPILVAIEAKTLIVLEVIAVLLQKDEWFGRVAVAAVLTRQQGCPD